LLLHREDVHWFGLVAVLALGCNGGGYTPPDKTTTDSGVDIDRDGFSIAQGDCDDDDDTVYPGANDVVGDEIDQNCDEVDGLDADGDGHASQGSGGLDCDDAEDTVFPGAPEIGWDLIDQDCDGEDNRDFLEVSAGRDHTCALDTTGEIRCFGSDVQLQVSNHPTDEGWKHICSGAEYSCAVHDDGRLSCWGSDSAHQYRDAPTDRTDWDSVTCGREFACALDLDGVPTCWGLDDDGQVSNVEDALEYTSIAAGETFACGVTRQQSYVVCWGSDTYDQIADRPMPPDDKAISVVAGWNHACAIRDDLGLWCWGDRNLGQVSSPNDAGPYVQLAASGNMSCGLLDNQRLSCWGVDNQYQVSDVPDDVDVRYVGVGGDHGCAIRSDNGRLICWGKDNFGQTTSPWE
jgi:alpha-tubulin suppressor-like RCC1 family protein